ncbi:MAG: hypothetical protein AB7K63_17030 [Vicinamibacterales bacterium]
MRIVRDRFLSRVVVSVLVGAWLAWPAVANAQAQGSAQMPEVHEHVAVDAALLTPTREASGTAWLPPATPMFGVHRPCRGWDVRVNGVAFAHAVYEPGERHRTGGAGTRQGGSLNWGMFMARRSLAGGRFGIRTMFSAEPWTVPGCGTLSFLATGEVCDDDTVHDRQQPHDLFMELAVDYDHHLRGSWRWQIYAGLAGEPALGPPGYPHRVSAMVNPIGPISHHWLDSTHVTFGVATAAAYSQRWKAEWSVFNGREPDERRADLDLGGFDSFAGRLSFLPTERLALQVSAARLREVATDFPFPGQDPVTRGTASAVYHMPLHAGGFWATTLAVGANHAREVVAGGLLDATRVGALLESSLSLSGRHTLFGRGEVGGVPAHHLHAREYPESIFTVGKVQVGYVRHLREVKGLVPGIGGTVAVSLLPPDLAPRYFGRAAPSVAVFLSVRAAEHAM